MNIPILFADDDLIVIDKPYGIVVNRAESVKEQTIQDFIESRFPFPDLSIKNEENKDFFDRNGIVHRLDKETSGCLMIAKNIESFGKLQSFFKQRLVHKQYVALVHGKIVSQTGSINVPIGRLPWDREKFGVVPGGKESETKFEVINYYKGQDKRQLKKNEEFTLLKLFPLTGRTHQIRVHLKYLGYPIVGDYLYAGRKQQVHDRKWCPRVFLHAQVIDFPHPRNLDKIMHVESPLPQDLELILKQLTIA